MTPFLIPIPQPVLKTVQNPLLSRSPRHLRQAQHSTLPPFGQRARLMRLTFRGLLQKLKMFLRCLIEHLFLCVDSEDIEEFIEEGGSLLHPQLRLVTT